MNECKFRTNDGKCSKYCSKSACIPSTKDIFGDNAEVVEIGEVCRYSSIFGNTYTAITKEQLERLKEGKALFINDGEYGHFIILEGD